MMFFRAFWGKTALILAHVGHLPYHYYRATPLFYMPLIEILTHIMKVFCYFNNLYQD